MLLRSLAGATVLAAAVLSTPVFAAQAPAGNDQAQAAQAAPVTDQEVQNFADAHKEVMSVRKEYAGKAKGVKDRKKLSKMKMDMQKDMIQAVQDSGMDVKRYNRIARLSQKDEDVRKRIQKALKQ